MRTVTIVRESSTDEGTFGIVTMDDGTTFHSGELPWKNNQNGVSCIPSGIYNCVTINSPSHGICYLIENVPNRTMCEIHKANWMGDESKGYKCELKGCIALGISVGVLNDQKAIISSGAALEEFMKNLGNAPFRLEIKWKDD